jgi:hypothetical protein
MHELQKEGPPRCHLPQWKTFKRQRASCFRISNTGIGSHSRFCRVPGVQTAPETAAEPAAEHQQKQQQQAEECAQIQEDFGKWQLFENCNAITQAVSNVNDFCRPTPPLFLNLKPVGKPTFRLQVLADRGATRSLISLSIANKHRCEITVTSICLSAVNATKINVSETTSLQVVEKGRRVHTIITVVYKNVDQTIVGWKDLMVMGIILPDWPAMPQQETEGKILAADKDEEEKELGKLKTHMLNKNSTVFSDTINEKPIAGTPMKIHLRDDIQINPQK